MKRELAALVLLGSLTHINAGPITYTDVLYGGSGSLNGVSFNGATVIATFTGDTSNIAPIPLPGVNGVAIPVSGSVFVQGVGSAALADSPMYLANFVPTQVGQQTVVFFDAGPGGIGWPNECPSGPSGSCYLIGEFATQSSSLIGYNLTSPFGPVSGVGGASTVSQIAPNCGPPDAGPQCAYYPTTSGGTFYWTTSPATGTFASPDAQNGGSAASPVVLDSNVGQVLGTIGPGEVEWYQFYWAGGDLNTSALVETTDDVTGSYSFLLADGTLFGNIISSETLNSANGWDGTIDTDLPAGTYGIGLSATGTPDPSFMINFNSAPEPSSFVLLLIGLAGVSSARTLRKRTRAGQS